MTQTPPACQLMNVNTSFRKSANKLTNHVQLPGTYRCVVQDATFHIVKTVYWGIRVLPVGILNLDYESSLVQWDSTGNQQNQTMSDQQDYRTALLYTVRLGLESDGF